MIKPNLFIPGFAKSGTSSLYEMLLQHPKIAGGFKKESHTYTKSYLYKNRFQSSRPESFKRLYGNGNTKYILDSSTSYLVYPLALERIKEDTPNAKFIVLCRDPIDRIISHYNWLVTKDLVDKDFKEEILAHGLDKFNPDIHYGGRYKNYIDFSSYGTHLELIYNLFGKHSVFFIKFEELISSWQPISERLWNFLNIEASSIKTIHENKTEGSCKNKDSLSLGAKLIRRAKNEYHILNGHTTRSSNVSKPIHETAERGDIDYLFLMRYLKTDLKKFIKLGFDLDGWETTKAIYNGEVLNK